ARFHFPFGGIVRIPRETNPTDASRAATYRTGRAARTPSHPVARSGASRVPTSQDPLRARRPTTPPRSRSLRLRRESSCRSIPRNAVPAPAVAPPPLLPPLPPPTPPPSAPFHY